MKRVMPFVQSTRQMLEQLGPKALAVTLEFNEAEVLKNNSIYLSNTLDVSIFCTILSTAKYLIFILR